MRVRSVLEAAYGWWLWRDVRRGPLPAHVGVIMDGNRRWARGARLANPSLGHQHGAEHLETVLGWCGRLGIQHVTAWVASADNIRKRDRAEVAFLMHLAETTIPRAVQRSARWRLHVAGQLDLLPDTTARALKEAVEATRDLDGVGDLTIAIGYSGREEIVAAVHDLLDEARSAGSSLAVLGASLTEADIAAHLYHPQHPAPDLIIRTSGEQRLSDFLLWQSVASRLYFVDVHWPAFRHVDLLRALRDYAARRRGEGSQVGAA